jgi:hypothetical protein
VEFRSGKRRVSPEEFFENLRHEAITLAMAKLEERARGAAASIVDPETGKHAHVFVRRKDETNFVLSTRGSPAFARELERRLEMTTGTVEAKGAQPLAEIPRLYLAHASEDHANLAKPLAVCMSANGIDVWLDEWEIRTGDSLRRKMEEGLESCTHFLVLLTPRSLLKPWVQTEIDAGFMRAIGGESRFLGVRVGTSLDDLSPFLRTLRCPEINLGNNQQVEELIADIHGVSRKPERGPAPKYVKTVPEPLAAWSKSAIAIAEYLVRNSKLGRKLDPQVTMDEIARDIGLPEGDVRLGVLDLTEVGLVERSNEIDSKRLWPTTSLFVEFDRHFLDFNNENDAKALTNWLVSKDVGMIEIDELAPHFPEWTQRRMNSALNYLHDAKLITPVIVFGQGPWVMKHLRVTDHTRRFVRDHG